MSAGIGQIDQKISLDLRPNVLAYAKAHHLDLTPEAINSLETSLNSFVRIDGSSVSFVVGDGKTGTIDEALALYTEGMPRTPASSAKRPNSATMTPTERAIARNRAERDGRSATAIAAITSSANPWAPSTWNRTHQALITNADPTKAAQLRTQAERP